jgi:MFS family permease
MRAIEDRRGHTPSERLVQRSLAASGKEGVVSQVMVGFLDAYLVPYALLLGATRPQIGFLAALPNLLTSISQLFAVRAVDAAGNRRRLILGSLLAQFVFLLPMGFLVYFPFRQRILVLVLLVAGFRTLGSLMGPAWGSLVSEYLPPERRGDYFGWRSRMVAISSLCGMAVWGAFLFLWKKYTGVESSGFFILFLCCTGLRILSLYYMSQMVEFPLHRTEDSEFTLWMFLRRFRESNFVKFVFFVSAMTFAIQIAAPYFSVYMLSDLHFSYLGYSAVSIASIAAGLVSFQLWGRHADAVGTARVLKSTGLLIPLSPLLWLFFRRPAGLFVVELFSGFVWGGFNLCATNFIYDAVSPAKRVRCLGYFSLINGMAAFAGASVGGLLQKNPYVLFGSSLAPLFLLSAAVRFAANLLLSRHFKEVRESAEPVSNVKLFFSVLGLRPILGRNSELTTPVPAGAAVHFGNRDKQPRRKSEQS